MRPTSIDKEFNGVSDPVCINQFHDANLFDDLYRQSFEKRIVIDMDL